MGKVNSLGGLCAAVLAFVAGLWLATSAAAHEVRPALVQINQTGPGDDVVTWKQPVVGDMAVRMTPRLSSGVLDKPANREEVTPAFRIRVWKVVKVASSMDRP